MTEVEGKTATHVRKIEVYDNAHLYRLDPPFKDHEYVVVSKVPAYLYTKPETLVFASNDEGDMIIHTCLGGGHFLNPEQALATLGYEIQPME